MPNAPENKTERGENGTQHQNGASGRSNGSSGHANGYDDSPPPPTDQQPARELTQVDHMNKQMLMALFQRMDEKDTPLAKMLEDDNPKEDSEFD